MHRRAVIGLCGLVNTVGYTHNLEPLAADQKLRKRRRAAAATRPLMGQVARGFPFSRGQFRLLASRPTPTFFAVSQTRSRSLSCLSRKLKKSTLVYGKPTRPAFNLLDCSHKRKYLASQNTFIFQYNIVVFTSLMYHDTNTFLFY